jgi:putative membrane protein
MMYWSPAIHGGGVLAMTATMLVIAGMAVAVVILLVRYTAPAPAQARTLPPADLAEAVLAERYARGDIDDVEYRRRLSLLRSAHHRLP